MGALKTVNMSPPLVLKGENFSEPKERVYYILSGDGLFLVKNFPIYRSCTKVENGLPWLQGQSENFELNLPKIPCALFERVVAFFQVIYCLHRSEAMVFLYYHLEQGAFEVVVPQQVVTSKGFNNGDGWSYHLHYSGVPTPAGFIRVGTIHSHADLPAFYSVTDEQDSEFDDSLNLVVGNVDRARLSLSACFMVDGKKFELEPWDILEDFVRPCFPVPRTWIDKVTVK